MAEIPELTCEGCKARDAMIQKLAAELDRERETTLLKPAKWKTEPSQDGRIHPIRFPKLGQSSK